MNTLTKEQLNKIQMDKLFNTSESIETVIKSFLVDIFTNLGYKKLNEQIAFYRKLTEDYHFLYYYSRKNILIRFKINI